MPAPQNKLKTALQNGEVQMGLWLALANPTTAAIAAGAGYDWCLIDGEHGPNTVATILTQVQAMAGQGATVVARIPAKDEHIVKQVLDLGIQTILVPLVDTAEEARAIVASTRYGPDGIRGHGAGLTRASDYGAIEDYGSTANDQICVMVQAETQKAMDNLAEIAAVDGVDGVFIGPADLSADMGFLGRPDAPEVVNVIEKGIDTIKAAGKAPGIVTFKIEALKRYADQGVTFLGVGGDATTYAKAVRDLAHDANSILTQGR
jgi:4-hydroxy-2-oxoheptanedioate aldolase